jgi:opacity protein-like surface antigen
MRIPSLSAGIIPGVLCGALLLASASSAVASPVAVTAQAGTLGAGGSLYLALPYHADVRFGGNYFSLSHALNSGGVHYDGTVRLQSFTLLADWHPFHGVFRLTGGVAYNDNRFSLTATPAAGKGYTIHGHPYTVKQVGSLTGVVTFNRANPYFGIGLGNPFRGGHWTFGLDLGMLYQGTPKVSLNATGAIAGSNLAKDVLAAADQVRSDVHKYKWYPVAMFSVGYRF